MFTFYSWRFEFEFFSFEIIFKKKRFFDPFEIEDLQFLYFKAIKWFVYMFLYILTEPDVNWTSSENCSMSFSEMFLQICFLHAPSTKIACHSKRSFLLIPVQPYMFSHFYYDFPANLTSYGIISTFVASSVSAQAFRISIWYSAELAHSWEFTQTPCNVHVKTWSRSERFHTCCTEDFYRLLQLELSLLKWLAVVVLCVPALYVRRAAIGFCNPVLQTFFGRIWEPRFLSSQDP